jgi:hypothetical protein
VPPLLGLGQIRIVLRRLRGEDSIVELRTKEGMAQNL